MDFSLLASKELKKVPRKNRLGYLMKKRKKFVLEILKGFILSNINQYFLIYLEKSNGDKQILVAKSRYESAENELKESKTELKALKDKENERKKCCICLEDNSAEFAALPCGHLAYCGKCIVDKRLWNNHICGMCKKYFDGFKRIYI